MTVGGEAVDALACYNNSINFRIEIKNRSYITMRILGIDPGYAILGYGVVDMKGNRFSVCGYGAVTTDSTMDMPDRLKHLYTEIMEIIREYEPDVVSIEELFFNTNVKTAIMVGQARGVAILACANSGVEIYEYTPLQIKQGLVGYGRAEKKQIQAMVKTILHLEEVPKPDDTADALAAAICHGHCAGHLSKLDNYNKQLEKYNNLNAPKKRTQGLK